MRALAIAIVMASLVGCAGSQFAKYIGVYSGVDLTLDYGHNFGDPRGDGIAGVLAAEHGNFGESNFSVDRSDQYPNDYVRTGFTILLRPE